MIVADVAKISTGMSVFLINVTSSNPNRLQANRHFKKIVHSIEKYLTNKELIPTICDAAVGDDIVTHMVDAPKLIGIVFKLSNFSLFFLINICFPSFFRRI